MGASILTENLNERNPLDYSKPPTGYLFGNLRTGDRIRLTRDDEYKLEDGQPQTVDVTVDRVVNTNRFGRYITTVEEDEFANGHYYEQDDYSFEVVSWAGGFPAASVIAWFADGVTQAAARTHRGWSYAGESYSNTDLLALIGDAPIHGLRAAI